MEFDAESVLIEPMSVKSWSAAAEGASPTISADSAPGRESLPVWVTETLARCSDPREATAECHAFNNAVSKYWAKSAIREAASARNACGTNAGPISRSKTRSTASESDNWRERDRIPVI
jgi:hypothetical protein